MISHKINLIIATSVVVLLTYVDFCDAITEEECNVKILVLCDNNTDKKKIFEYLFFNKTYADLQNPDKTVTELLTEFFEQFIKAIFNDELFLYPEEYCVHHIMEDTGICRSNLTTAYSSISTTEVDERFKKKPGQKKYSYVMYTFLYIKTDTPRMAEGDTPTSPSGKSKKPSFRKPKSTYNGVIDYKYLYMKLMLTHILESLKLDEVKSIPTFCKHMKTNN